MVGRDNITLYRNVVSPNSISLAEYIDAPRPILDPISNVGPFPPVPRSVLFADVRKGKGQVRLTVDQYIADVKVGWGQYTRPKLMTLSWLDAFDRPLSKALRYQATVDLAATGLTPSSHEWHAAFDNYYFERGVFTAAKLAECDLVDPQHRWAARFLTFVLKQSTPLRQGGRAAVGADSNPARGED